MVVAKDIDRDSLILGPDFCNQRLNTLPADTVAEVHDRGSRILYHLPLPELVGSNATPLHFRWWLPFFTFHLLSAAATLDATSRRMGGGHPPFTYHLSLITYHLSLITYHLSPFTVPTWVSTFFHQPPIPNHFSPLAYRVAEISSFLASPAPTSTSAEPFSLFASQVTKYLPAGKYKCGVES